MTDMAPIDLSTIPDTSQETAQAARTTVHRLVPDPEARDEILAMLGLA